MQAALSASEKRLEESAATAAKAIEASGFGNFGWTNGLEEEVLLKVLKGQVGRPIGPSQRALLLSSFFTM